MNQINSTQWEKEWFSLYLIVINVYNKSWSKGLKSNNIGLLKTNFDHQTEEVTVDSGWGNSKICSFIDEK